MNRLAADVYIFGWPAENLQPVFNILFAEIKNPSKKIG